MGLVASCIQLEQFIGLLLQGIGTSLWTRLRIWASILARQAGGGTWGGRSGCVPATCIPPVGEHCTGIRGARCFIGRGTVAAALRGHQRVCIYVYVCVGQSLSLFLAVALLCVTVSIM